MESFVMDSEVKPKERTKAKQKYLKRKKERRKLGKKLAQNTSTGKAEAKDEESVVDTANHFSNLLKVTLDQPVSEKSGKRPKKRQKVLEVIDEPDIQSATDEVDVEMEVALSDRDHAPPAPSPTLLEGALPQFPRPARPDAPSKATLALQGLDRAVQVAEVVDPATSLPLHTADLSEKTKSRLNDLGITELFAVQTSLLPFLLPTNKRKRALYLPFDPPRDVCVSAPTGSGKTLAYVLPIIEILSSRVVTRLRALIVVPTRDLVTQVRETLEALGKGRGLKIATATGQHSFSHEQEQLIADRSPSIRGGSSKVDILICTPGRLIDHIKETPNFSLQHLRFLVIDEADRLLAQSFQGWLAQVLAAIRPPKVLLEPIKTGGSFESPHDAIAPSHLAAAPEINQQAYVPETAESSCQKLLFSATLTHDPERIAALQLRNPKYFVVQSTSNESKVLDVAMEKFTMPTTLNEHMIVCESAVKPLVFFHLLRGYGVTNALVFTKSTESTSRLVRLLDFFEQARISADGDGKQLVACAYSSDLSAAERKSILEKFKSQEIQILICSDLISRGIDISHVSHVVSYDVPVDIRKYVHRVGRTARAGRQGDAWTLVEEQEARYFKSMLNEAGHSKVKRLRVGEKDMESIRPFYEKALGWLRDVYAR